MSHRLLPVPMPLLATALAGLLLLGGCASPLADARAEGWAHYGAVTHECGGATALRSLDGGEEQVVVDATIVEVCLVKGCWMTITADGVEEPVMVRFRDYAFFVPRNASGHRVVLRGDAALEEASVEELRHLAEDAGASDAEIAAIVAPRRRLVIVADSVYIDGDSLDAPWSASSSG